MSTDTFLLYSIFKILVLLVNFQIGNLNQKSTDKIAKEVYEAVERQMDKLA